MENAVVISPDDIVFDIRSLFKCKWGCEQSEKKTIKCDTRGTKYEDRLKMIKSYEKILLIHSHNAQDVSKAIIEIERAAFLDGHHFAFGVRYCNLCADCKVMKGENCPTPENIRPCEGIFSIDMFSTVRNLGLPINVLKNKDEQKNRYGFILMY